MSFKEMPIDSPHEPVGPPSVWKENHGNLLLGFGAVILVIGAAILAYRQNRFRPPRFPTAEAITVVETTEVVDPATAVTITIAGAASDNGNMMVAIYEDAGSFNDPDNAALLKSLELSEGTAVLAVPSEMLPARMAVTAYHDENGDGELNRNQFGIPTERYGFSRDARGLTGPPEFDQAVLDRPANGDQINVEVR